jgi:hypothetical protein
LPVTAEVASVLNSFGGSGRFTKILSPDVSLPGRRCVAKKMA